jgi:hypothetical protein
VPYLLQYLQTHFWHCNMLLRYCDIAVSLFSQNLSVSHQSYVICARTIVLAQMRGDKLIREKVGKNMHSSQKRKDLRRDSRFINEFKDCLDFNW